MCVFLYLSMRVHRKRVQLTQAKSDKQGWICFLQQSL